MMWKCVLLVVQMKFVLLLVWPFWWCAWLSWQSLSLWCYSGGGEKKGENETRERERERETIVRKGDSEISHLATLAYIYVVSMTINNIKHMPAIIIMQKEVIWQEQLYCIGKYSL